MDPYETDPEKIPPSDPYADIPFYGRYKPWPVEFVPNPPPGPSTSAASIQYWEGIILDQCTPTNRMYGFEGWRDIFALGNIIIKSSHLSATPPVRDFSRSDANEPVAISLAAGCLRELGIQAPTILFQGQINQRDVIVQSRIPGVALNVAWPYLSQADKASFKEQTRKIVRLLDEKVPHQPSVINAAASSPSPSFVAPDLDPLGSQRLTEVEYALLFGEMDGTEMATGLGFAHNDLNESNIIVRDGKIVGLVDWEVAGFFGLARAGKVHALCRTSKPEDFKNTSFSKEKIADLSFWNDLYVGL